MDVGFYRSEHSVDRKVSKVEWEHKTNEICHEEEGHYNRSADSSIEAWKQIWKGQTG